MGFAEQDKLCIDGEVDVVVDFWDTKLACRLATTHSEEQAASWDYKSLLDIKVCVRL
jgi:hypothetical protein